jgi:hypothetical protein
VTQAELATSQGKVKSLTDDAAKLKGSRLNLSEIELCCSASNAQLHRLFRAADLAKLTEGKAALEKQVADANQSAAEMKKALSVILRCSSQYEVSSASLAFAGFHCCLLRAACRICVGQ